MTKDEALKLALDALQKIYIAPEHEEYIRVWWPACEQAIPAIKEALAQPEQKCWCTTCRPITMTDMRFVVCPDCGNKRCPKANDHRNACTNNNEVGQKGSSWEHVKPLAQPEQDSVAMADYMALMEKYAFLKAQRTWVGLTNNEIALINADYPHPQGFARAIESAHGIKENT